MKSYKDHRVLALNDFQDKDYEDVMKIAKLYLKIKRLM